MCPHVPLKQYLLLGHCTDDKDSLFTAEHIHWPSLSLVESVYIILYTCTLYLVWMDGSSVGFAIFNSFPMLSSSCAHREGAG